MILSYNNNLWMELMRSLTENHNSEQMIKLKLVFWLFTFKLTYFMTHMTQLDLMKAA